MHCGAGRVCELDEDDEPMCVCIPDCPMESEPRRKVCSNHNETWDSDCSVYQHRCWCDIGDPRCKGDEFKHVHIEYYGECREMPVSKLFYLIFIRNKILIVSTLKCLTKPSNREISVATAKEISHRCSLF